MPTACRPKLKPVIWLLYFLCLLLVLLGLALWMPFRVELDTEQGIYQVQWRGIFKLIKVIHQLIISQLSPTEAEATLPTCFISPTIYALPPPWKNSAEATRSIP